MGQEHSKETAQRSPLEGKRQRKEEITKIDWTYLRGIHLKGGYVQGQMVEGESSGTE